MSYTVIPAEAGIQGERGQGNPRPYTKDGVALQSETLDSSLRFAAFRMTDGAPAIIPAEAGI